MKKSRILSLLALMLLVSAPVSAVGVVAKTGATKVLVEDRQIAAQSYEIEGFNYFKLRDLLEKHLDDFVDVVMTKSPLARPLTADMVSSEAST